MRRQAVAILHCLPYLLLLLSLSFGLSDAEGDEVSIQIIRPRSPGNELQPRGQKRKALDGNAPGGQASTSSQNRRSPRTRNLSNPTEERSPQRQRVGAQSSQSPPVQQNVASGGRLSPAGSLLPEQRESPPRRSSPQRLQQQAHGILPARSPERGRSTTLPVVHATTGLGAHPLGMAAVSPVQPQASSAGIIPTEQVCSITWSISCLTHLSTPNLNQFITQGQHYQQSMQIRWPPAASPQQQLRTPPSVLQWPANSPRYWQFPSSHSPPILREIPNPAHLTQPSTQIFNQPSAVIPQLQQQLGSVSPPRAMNQPAPLPSQQQMGNQFSNLMGLPSQQLALMLAAGSPQRQDSLPQRASSPIQQPRPRNQFAGLFDSPPRQPLRAMSPPPSQQNRNQFRTPGSPMPGDPFFLPQYSLLNQPFLPALHNPQAQMHDLAQGGHSMQAANQMPAMYGPHLNQAVPPNPSFGIGGIPAGNPFGQAPGQGFSPPTSPRSTIERGQASFANRQFLGANSNIALGQSSVQQFETLHHGTAQMGSIARPGVAIQQNIQPQAVPDLQAPLSWDMVREQHARQSQQLDQRLWEERVQLQAQQILQRSRWDEAHARALLQQAAQQRAQAPVAQPQPQPQPARPPASRPSQAQVPDVPMAQAQDAAPNTSVSTKSSTDSKSNASS